MASTSLALLLNQAVTADVQSEVKTLQPKAKSFIGWLEVSNYVAGTFNVTIQHSPDKVNWKTLATFAAAAANLTEEVQITNSAFVNVRANVSTAGGPDATVKVQLWYDNDR